MTCYEWDLRDEQTAKNPPIRILNEALRKIGGTARLRRNNSCCCLVVEFDETHPLTGRPRKEVREDLTINQIRHARFLGVPMTEIAQSLGISTRTLHRRWKAVIEEHINPETPYSKWP